MLYRKGFYNIKESVFFILLSSSDYVDNLFDLFFNIIISDEYTEEIYELGILKIITKIEFYLPINVSYSLNQYDKVRLDSFLKKYFIKLKKILSIYVNCGNNMFMTKRFTKIINIKAKLMIQFLKILGEYDYNYSRFVTHNLNIDQNNILEYYNEKFVSDNLNDNYDFQILNEYGMLNEYHYEYDISR